MASEKDSGTLAGLAETDSVSSKGSCITDNGFKVKTTDGTDEALGQAMRRNEEGQAAYKKDLADSGQERDENAPCGNDITDCPELTSQGNEPTKIEVKPSFKEPRLGRLYREMLDKKPAPNKGPVRFPVWSPYARGDGVEFEFRLSRSGDLKRGKYDAQVKLRASKRGEEPVWISPGSAKGYRDAGYRVPVAPKIMGLDRIASSDPDDLVFITDTPLDYYALNCALLRESVFQFGAIEEGPGEAVGCAVMGLEGYEFDDRVANDFLTGKRVVVVDYGRNTDGARKIAENISLQGMAESVRVWRLDPAAADQGLFKRYKFPECETAFQLKFSCADLWSDIRSRLDSECGEVTPNGPEGGMLKDLKTKVEPTKYYLYPFIPKKKISFLAGAGGVGKSQILTDWAARLSRGENEIVESRYEQDDFGKVKVLWLTREEDINTDVTPRLLECGANEDYVKVVKCVGPGYSLKFGDQQLADVIRGEGGKEPFIPDVVFVDSFQAFLHGDTNNGDDVVEALDWLTALMDEAGVSFEIIHHFRKGGGDFRDSISGRHEIYDYSRFMGVAIKDPKDESRIVVHAKKKSKTRGIDRIPNLIYESCCRDEKDAAPFAKKVDEDNRSEETLAAQHEQNRIDAREKVSGERKSKIEEVAEAVREEYETRQIIVIERVKDRLGSTYGKNSISNGFTAAVNELKLVKKRFEGTIFSKRGFGGGIGGPVEPTSYVYVAPEDSLDSADGIVQLALSLKDPITEAKIKKELPNTRGLAKPTKAALKQLVEVYGFTEVDGAYYHPESVKGRIADAARAIGGLEKPISVADAMELTGEDATTVRAAFEMLVSECEFTLSRDRQTVIPPQEATQRGNTDGQQVLTEDMKSRVL